MRVTSGMIFSMTSVNITNQYEEMFRVSETLTSGKRINRPSDDPIDAPKVLDYRTLLGALKQYKKNVERGTSLLRYTESALAQAGYVLTEAKVLAEQMATGSYNEDQRKALATQAEQLFRQLLQIANTQVSGRYIFSGFKTDTQPFVADDNFNVTYQGDNNQIRLAVQQNSTVAVNITGQAAFLDATNVFTVLRDLRIALRENDQAAIGRILPRIDDAMTQIQKVRAYVGTSLKELETTSSVLDDIQLNAETLLSETEDTDIADAVTKLAQRQMVYEASLKSTAMITQLSLVQFV
ncbi:MAG: flagellar hook-associated protein FlgL [Desulfobacterota bacterium]|nr:flagellar hook-associated protein FlgL [Thermodesulfobacteriota bacterium]